jgi:uncharacterized protein
MAKKANVNTLGTVESARKLTLFTNAVLSEVTMNRDVLIIPGIGNSGPNHWQTIWECADPAMVRLHVPDWDRPVCSSWVDALDVQTRQAGQPLVVVAHSLGCLAFVHWIERHQEHIGGAMLVAVPDPDGSNFPREADGFSEVPMQRIPCRTVIVSSENDPYSSVRFAQSCADAWGSELVTIGRAGHVNSESNLGKWPQGQELLRKLRGQAKRTN